MQRILFWLIYSICALWGQFFVPSADFFLPALLLALQDDDSVQLFWVASIAILLQEGMGSLAFGSVVLLYGTLIFFFHIFQWYVKIRTYLFVLLFAFCATLLHNVVLVLFCFLQDFDYRHLLSVQQSFLYFVTIPLVWQFCIFIKQKVSAHGKAF